MDDLSSNSSKTLKAIEKSVKALEQEYSPSQGAGVLLTRASMNYYTVNKKPKDYSEKPQNPKNQLENDTFTTIKKNKNKNNDYEWRDRNLFFAFKSEQEKEWLRINLGVSEEKMSQGIKLTIQETYEIMKEFKAEQKAIFYEVIKKLANNDRSDYEIKNPNFLLLGFTIPYANFKDWKNLNKTFSLFPFKTEEDYQKFIDLDEEIQRLATKRNQSKNPEEKKRLGTQVIGKEKRKRKVFVW